MSKIAAASGVLLCACATTGLPDLVVSRLAVDPAEAAAGDSLVVTSEVLNAGRRAAPVAVAVALYAAETAAEPVAELAAWTGGAEGLAPGARLADAAPARIPLAVPPGGYFICAAADPDGVVAEQNEDDNRRCAPFTVLPGPPRAADLVIEKVTPLAEAEASRLVRIKIKNAGAAPAANFRIMAFKRAPREPLLLIECPLTEGQRAAGSPAGCGDLSHRQTLAPGASAEIDGYFAYVVANGAAFVRQPLDPNDRPPPTTRTVDFMVDGCFPPIDRKPVHCDVAEVDELNNFRAATFAMR
jgi:hypothetical protein